MKARTKGQIVTRLGPTRPEDNDNGYVPHHTIRSTQALIAVDFDHIALSTKTVFRWAAE